MGVFDAVATSAVRRTVLLELHERPRQRLALIERAGRVGLVAPMYHDRYAAALERAAVGADARLLLDSSVLHEVEEREGADRDADNPRVRVADSAFAMVVTDDALVLALPDADGSFDLDGKLRATGDRALDWGNRLFEYAWSEGAPLDATDERATH